MAENNSVRIIQTEDGSSTLYSSLFDSTYHSRHGAVQESMHVYIEHGLRHIASQKQSINLLEMGFGTGLNAWLTLLECEKSPTLSVQYTGYELHPLPKAIIEQLELPNFGSTDFQKLMELHVTPWEEAVEVRPNFRLRKVATDFRQATLPSRLDLVYFDAFGPGRQPDLWDELIAQKLWRSMVEGGVLVTFCTKGDFKRALKAAGFKVKRLPGPPGKREMLRATK